MNYFEALIRLFNRNIIWLIWFSCAQQLQAFLYKILEQAAVLSPSTLNITSTHTQAHTFAFFLLLSLAVFTTKGHKEFGFLSLQFPEVTFFIKAQLCVSSILISLDFTIFSSIHFSFYAVPLYCALFPCFLANPTAPFSPNLNINHGE